MSHCTKCGQRFDACSDCISAEFAALKEENFRLKGPRPLSESPRKIIADLKEQNALLEADRNDWKVEAENYQAKYRGLLEQNALLTVQVPEGWKLVPVEPTADMTIAAGDGYEAGEVIGPASCYRVMIAAAPALPQQVKSEDARDAARYRHVRSGILNCSFIVRQARYDGKWVEMGCDVLDEAIDAALSAQD